jgi:ComF family protein
MSPQRPSRSGTHHCVKSWGRRLRDVALDGLAPLHCAGCGESGRALCEECVRAIESQPVPLLGGARAAFLYETEVRRILHRGKFRDCRAALRTLAWMGATRFQAPDGAVVTPVPLSRRRAAERGYNQAQVVARAVAEFHRLPLSPLLERSRDTAPQSSLDRAARQANVDGAFSALPATRGATVWLIDDVLTTGATSRAAREVLLAAGAARVEIAVLAAVL